MVTMVLLLVSYVIGSLHIKQQQSERRYKVITELTTIGNRLEGIVRSTFNLTQGIVYLISYQGNISIIQFESLSQMAMEDNRFIRNIAIAPNNTIAMVFPFKGNEKALGLNYMESEDQWPSVKRAITSQAPVLAGPVNLVQGGIGLINRFPVYISTSTDTTKNYWGIVSVVAYYDSMLYDAGIFSSKSLRIALQGHDGMGAEGNVIAGDTLILEQNPVIVDIVVPGGNWRLVAIPASGWGSNSVFDSGYFIISMVLTFLVAIFLAILLQINQSIRAKNLLLAQEINERKRVEVELKKAKDNAEEANRVKTVFLANMSHEIRTPMNAIQGFTDLILKGIVSNKSTMDYIEIINNSSRRLLSVINDIIDVSIIEAGQMNIINESVSLNELLKNIYLLNKKNAKDKGIDLQVNFGFPDSDDLITIDGHRLSQVINNLVTNAIKFTAIGSVEFGYIVEDNTLNFFVRDTGVGIPEHYQKVIFERFRQADERFSRDYGGVGLGLSICKSIIELMNGKIWFETKENVGTTFFFELPFFKEKRAMSTLDYKEEQICDLQGKIILIAEDDDYNYIFLNELIKKTKASVLRACNGKEVIELLEENSEIDLILMDIKMPVMNGYEAIAYIRKRDIRIPIIAQTAYAMDEEKQLAINAGCNHYITKPIDQKDFYSVLQSVFS